MRMENEFEFYCFIALGVHVCVCWTVVFYGVDDHFLCDNATIPKTRWIIIL